MRMGRSFYRNTVPALRQVLDRRTVDCTSGICVTLATEQKRKTEQFAR